MPTDDTRPDSALADAQVPHDAPSTNEKASTPARDATSPRDSPKRSLPLWLVAFCLVVESGYMIMETIASRMLSPYFGNSTIVWTCIIGIILLGSSIGNQIGGRLLSGDGRRTKFVLVASTWCGSVFVVLTPIIARFCLPETVDMTPVLEANAVMGTLLLFLIPSCAIGAASPAMMLSATAGSTEDTVGARTGTMYSLVTIGGLIGTFVGGFLLVPNLTSGAGMLVVASMFALACLLAALSPSGVPAEENSIGKARPWLPVLALVPILSVSGIGIMTMPSASTYSPDVAMRATNTDGILEYDSEYNKIMVYDTNIVENGMGVPIRVLQVGYGFESMTYTEEGRHYDLASQYTRLYDKMFDIDPNISDVMMIGGGGYSYPKHYISSHEDGKMTVVEIDPMVTEIAKKHFYLQDLIDEYGLSDGSRLSLVNKDGRTYLNANTHLYDAILNDAFSGMTPVGILATQETAQRIHDSLKPNGLYLTNVIGATDGKNSRFLRSEMRTLSTVFKNVVAFPAEGCPSEDSTWNYMVIASDGEIPMANAVDYERDVDGVVLLTDDYCPVDTLAVTK